MGGLVVCFFMFMVFAFILATGGTAGLAARGLAGSGLFSGGPMGLANGTPARGIMLWVSSTGRRWNSGGMRYEIRRARVDVEQLGMQPYVVDIDVYIPGNLVRDVLPGSTMELRVGSDRQSALVIGPDVGYVQGAVRTT